MACGLIDDMDKYLVVKQAGRAGAQERVGCGIESDSQA